MDLLIAALVAVAVFIYLGRALPNRALYDSKRWQFDETDAIPTSTLSATKLSRWARHRHFARADRALRSAFEVRTESGCLRCPRDRGNQSLGHGRFAQGETANLPDANCATPDRFIQRDDVSVACIIPLVPHRMQQDRGRNTPEKIGSCRSHKLKRERRRLCVTGACVLFCLHHTCEGGPPNSKRGLAGPFGRKAIRNSLRQRRGTKLYVYPSR